MTAQGNRGLVFPMRAELEYNFEATTSSQLDLILRQQVAARTHSARRLLGTPKRLRNNKPGRAPEQPLF